MPMQVLKHLILHKRGIDLGQTGAAFQVALICLRTSCSEMTCLNATIMPTARR